MDILSHWDLVRTVVEKALETNSFCAMGTVNPDGSPHLTPIGSICLHEPGKGYYLESFPMRMRENLENDPRICVMAVQGGFGYMMKALFTGRFDSAPGVRLLGRAGPRRPVTTEEARRFRDKVKRFRWLKGHDILWKDMAHARDITFESFEPLRLGPMTRGLWGGAMS